MKGAKDWRKKDYLLISPSACFWTRLWLWGAVLNCSADNVLESPQSQPRIEWVIKQGLCLAQCSVLFLCSHWTPAGQPLASWVQCVVTGFTSQHSELMPWGATEHPFEVPNETLAAFISLLPSGHVRLPWPNLRPSDIQTLVFKPCVGKNYVSFSIFPSPCAVVAFLAPWQVGLLFLLLLFFFEFTCLPHPDPPSHLPLHLLPPGLPRAPGPSACLMHPTWAGDLFHPW